VTPILYKRCLQFSVTECPVTSLGL
jgi:hypothetical protein